MVYAWKLARTVAVVIAITLTLLVAGIAMARAVYLPDSACAAPVAALERLELEKMSYRDVQALLGCDGVEVARQDYGGRIVVEHYAWRLDAWPFGRLQAQFIDGVLHGTDHRLLTLALDLPAR